MPLSAKATLNPMAGLLVALFQAELPGMDNHKDSLVKPIKF